MIFLDLDKKINGDLLQQELLKAGLKTDVVIYSNQGVEKIELNGVDEAHRNLAQSVYAAHNPPAPKEPTVEEKLASVGLSLDDLKEALGL